MILYENVNDSLNDFFSFLDLNHKKGTFASIHYVYRVKTNKYIIDDKKGKILNPYIDRIYKHTTYVFNFAESYRNAQLKTNPDWEYKGGSGEYEQVKGYNMIKKGKRGHYFPIISKNEKVNYTITDENDEHQPISNEEVKKYLPNRKSYGNIKYKNLSLDKILTIKASGRTWFNPDFMFNL